MVQSENMYISSAEWQLSAVNNETEKITTDDKDIDFLLDQLRLEIASSPRSASSYENKKISSSFSSQDFSLKQSSSPTNSLWSSSDLSSDGAFSPLSFNSNSSIFSNNVKQTSEELSEQNFKNNLQSNVNYFELFPPKPSETELSPKQNSQPLPNFNIPHSDPALKFESTLKSKPAPIGTPSNEIRSRTSSEGSSIPLGLIQLNQQYGLLTAQPLSLASILNAQQLQRLAQGYAQVQGQSVASSNGSPSKYKTEMCRQFSTQGTCKYGDKCQFAHGHRELRDLTRHPKYKTELCRTFHTTGFCNYGKRCHYIHDQRTDSGRVREEERAMRMRAQRSLSSSFEPLLPNANAPPGFETLTPKSPGFESSSFNLFGGFINNEKFDFRPPTVQQQQGDHGNRLKVFRSLSHV